jgi:alginate O-acetyltransferase complex protein AlgI
MPFNSAPYLVFLALAVAVYWLLRPRFRRVFVLLASLVFYASWSFVFVAIPVFMAGLVYVFGTCIQADTARAKRWSRLGIVCVLVPLIFFKYRVLLLANLTWLTILFGAHHLSWASTIALPVGISFYTFEAIAYLVDVRQGRVAMPKFMDLCLFFLFWPNIVSGPIVRARELVPQLSFRKPFEARFVFEGLDRVIWGLVQKNVIANILGIWVNKGFAQTSSRPSTLDAWFLAIAFGLQIYFDFAAYTNLAIGAARLLGIMLPENFRYPYHAATPPDFWARWHMTLSRWIRDYVFFPINAKWKGAPLPLYLSLLGAMALVGLWHGAGWGFIVWGALHGAYLVIYRMYESVKATRPLLNESRVASGVWRVLTLIAVTAAWVPFRAPTIAKAGSILSSMFYRFGRGSTYSSTFYMYTIVILFFCALEPLIVRSLREIEDHAGADGPSPFRIIVRPIVYLFGLLLFLLFDENNAQFIYSQF